MPHASRHCYTPPWLLRPPSLQTASHPLAGQHTPGPEPHSGSSTAGAQGPRSASTLRVSHRQLLLSSPPGAGPRSPASGGSPGFSAAVPPQPAAAAAMGDPGSSGSASIESSGPVAAMHSSTTRGSATPSPPCTGPGDARPPSPLALPSSRAGSPRSQASITYINPLFPNATGMGGKQQQGAASERRGSDSGSSSESDAAAPAGGLLPSRGSLVVARHRSYQSGVAAGGDAGTGRSRITKGAGHLSDVGREGAMPRLPAATRSASLLP
jgi:hypothetical protein